MHAMVVLMIGVGVRYCIAGAVVTFNLRWANGLYVGFSEVGRMAEVHGFKLRTGE